MKTEAVKFETKNDKLFINDQEVIKGYESFGGSYWFVTEIADKQTSVYPDGREFPNDEIYFGFVQGFYEEWGYFSKSELESLPAQVWEIKKIDLPYAGRRNLNEEIEPKNEAIITIHALNSEEATQESETKIKF